MIAVVNTFEESWKDFREHLSQWIKVAFVPFVLWLIGLVFMEMGSYLFGEFKFTITPESVLQNEAEGSLVLDLYTVIHYVLETLAGLVLNINGYRYAALGEGGDKWWTFPLNKRLLKIFLYYLFIFVLYIVCAVIATGITAGSYVLVENIFLTVLLAILLAVGLVGLMTRLSLTLLYVAVDQKEPLRTSWHLMKGNVLKLFKLFFLISFVVLGIAILGSAIIGGVGWILSLVNEKLGSIIFFLFVPFGFFIWFVSEVLMMKAIALVNKQLMENK
ncbi:MAG: hypothetical protein K2X28_07105 [Alphaproteobacteria bacterium]|nr:hypothetical protein [Alphaproteobacteria bacterium]